MIVQHLQQLFQLGKKKFSFRTSSENKNLFFLNRFWLIDAQGVI